MLFSKKVVLDTNFLLIPGQFRVDIFEEIKRIADFRFKLYIFEKTEKELENILKNAKTKDRMAANIAKKLIKERDISYLKGDEALSVDEQIIEFARSNECFVATQDAELKRKLKKEGKSTRFIVLRNRKTLAFA